MRLNGETKTWRTPWSLHPTSEPHSAAVVCLSSFRCRWGPPEPELSWGGVGGHFVRQPETIDLDLSWRRLSGPERVGHDPSLPTSLGQPGSLERLVDVPSFAPDGLGDLSGAHPFLAQGDNARAIESGGAALVIPFAFAASMPARCRSRMKPSSISATIPSTVKTIRPIGQPVSMPGSSTRRLAPFSSSSCRD